MELDPAQFRMGLQSVFPSGFVRQKMRDGFSIPKKDDGFRISLDFRKQGGEIDAALVDGNGFHFFSLPGGVSSHAVRNSRLGSAKGIRPSLIARKPNTVHFDEKW
jgi:hypothetical protein